MASLEFNVKINNVNVNISSVDIDVNDSSIIIISLEEALYYGGNVTVSYQGNSIVHNSQALENFLNLGVTNNLPTRYNVPSRIQSENFFYNNGLVAEECSDIGGGYNMGYAAPGDYLDYLVYVPESGNIDFNFRVASERSTSQIIIQIGEGNSFSPVDTITITGTGGWQIWKTVSSTAFLPKGRYTIRVYVRSGEFNTNWFELKFGTPVGTSIQKIKPMNIYPNPAKEYVTIQFSEMINMHSVIKFYNSFGQMIKIAQTDEIKNKTINTSDLSKGIYYITIENNSQIVSSSKLVIN
jgi:hypothetical protein